MKKYPVLFFSLALALLACSSPTGGGGGSVNGGSGLGGGGLGGSKTVFYVKATGTGDGSSWDNASGDIQEMIDKAAEAGGGEIWVAAGTYKPAHIPENASSDNRDKTFQLKPKVHIYGGFGGTEAVRSARDWGGNKTVLSGDFDCDDSGFANMTENAYHVVIAVGIPNDGQTMLDGFTIKGGNANGSDFITVGDDYTVVRFSGSGVYNDNSAPVLTNVTISGNWANNDGGGMYNDNSSPVLTSMTISDNQTSGAGGGMYNNSGSAPILTNVIISCNSASSKGGGVYNDNSSPVLTSVTISGNHASNGGGMSNWHSSPVLTNVIISGNEAASSGGGMDNDNSSPILTNVTISDNSAPSNTGGGMYNVNSSFQIRNSIIWNNGGAVNNNIWPYDSITTSLRNSMVEGINDTSNGNLEGTTDPLFINSSSGDYRLQSGSPVINKGNNDLYPASAGDTIFSSLSLSEAAKVQINAALAKDCGGGNRINGDAIDMGAYETP
ncbi:MAG: hypothetical protein LBJ31_06710 [Treponema sp.]|nr:hypothetical protein [Treponema sp.]